ncbi:MAG: hypothetical protein HN348_15735, partial [Proteobacteria bacterium]|nr:hypothetical protein [Pseudomonadota bacterium]
MAPSLLDFLRPTCPDEAQQRAEVALDVFLFGSIGVAFLYLYSLPNLDFSAVVAMLAVSLAGVFHRIAQVYPRPVAAALVVVVWVLGVFFAYLYGGIGSPALFLHLLCVLVATLLFGGRGAVVTAGLCIVTAVALSIAKGQGWLLDAFHAPTPIEEWLSSAVVLTFVLVPTYIATRWCIQGALRMAGSRDKIEARNARQRALASLTEQALGQTRMKGLLRSGVDLCCGALEL